MAAGNKSVGSTFMERLLHCCTLLGYSLLHCCALLVIVVAVVAPAEWITINDNGVPVLNEPGFIAGVCIPGGVGLFYASLVALIKRFFRRVLRLLRISN